MPRHFSDEERRLAGRRVLAAAYEEFSRAGYRGANVAGIARAAGIGKGTVYLLFDSKAAIFAAALAQVERDMRAELQQELKRRFDAPQQRLEFFFRALLTRMVDHPLLWIVVDPEEAMALFRDLGPQAAALNSADAEFFGNFVREWQRLGWLKDVDPDVFSGATRALFAVSLHRDLVGPAYASVVDMLVQALAKELAPTVAERKGRHSSRSTSSGRT